MDTALNKENDCTSVISQSVMDSHFSASPIKPLKSQRSLNSLNSPMNSPSRKLDPSPTRRRKMDQPATNPLSGLQKEYTQLERKYTDLLLKNNEISADYAQLEQDLFSKDSTIKEQKERIANYETYVRNIQDDYTKNKDLLNKEIYFYKELIEELQFKVKKLNSELDTNRKREKEIQQKSEDPKSQSDDLQDILEISEKFNRLLKDFKVLQSNFELERNSKLVLIDQIEFLTKENELLSNQNSSKNSVKHDEDLLEHIDQLNDSVINDFATTIHTMNELTDEDEEDNNDYDDQQPNNDLSIDDSNETDLNHSSVLNYFADELQINHSSPIKHQYGNDESLEISKSFQFPPQNLQPYYPPSPDPESKDLKRKSLPVKIRTSPHLDNEEFVLSPLKLATNTSHNYFDIDDNNTPNNTIERYSNSKPTHSRYNSYDIVPIKVEFETVHPSPRSTSVPEKEHQKKKFGVINETPELPTRGATKSSVRNSAFYALNGYDADVPSNRNSITTATSSKRSSMIMENPAQDMTKQEIMKLKFELQSLKLHNEKLLSYIGFELQKQKNHIKKLSNKQSARTLKKLNDVSKNIEYSDAKLIESSKDMLIHKKRVLRLVSINPILSKNYGNNNANKASNPIGIMNKGILPLANQLLEGFDPEHHEFIGDQAEDDYGFMNHNDKFSKRIFSSGLQAYLNCDELDETEGAVEDSFESENERNIKKYKSQLFLMGKVLESSDDDDDDDSIEEVEETEDTHAMKRKDSEWDSDGASLSSDEEMGMLTQIKYLILGSSAIMLKNSKKRREQQQLVDDGLKLKFMTITLGIMILGLKLSQQTNASR
ncbi:uncharacterized protein CANTADRAFT_3675 [Suhomyces tanzawaensis NRRL Y-17324]|uniref:Uncharacterized protein n=1 Tax=Suhomyces tanzawaensis NRRL Y-17324 TaxID=984487 RepID=A0A1E4SQ95_9ASCO|nr:uncharacterized protein CANTADRAFT_3675 [Suhomyces tanzawaensis NRRL Y-17324]ODV81582.1 hypothetical protein CANTADRAFT_3675 [Suhomyces tanzawaensis NRRL Y-17324]